MILKLCLAFFATFMVPMAACASPVIHYPVDAVSRAKFPTVYGPLIDELSAINKVVNSAITYQDDMSHYGVDDLWVQFPSDNKGDCEDYAVTKLGVIENLANADGNDNLNRISDLGDFRLVYVDVHYNDHDGKGWQTDGHEILAVRLPDHSVAYLDLNNNELMTRKELTHAKTYGGETAYYEFHDWIG